VRQLDQDSELRSTDSSLFESPESPYAPTAGTADTAATAVSVQEAAGSRRRGLLTLSVPLLAGLLAACGKVGFGGTTTTVRKVTKKQDEASRGAADGGEDGTADGSEESLDYDNEKTDGAGGAADGAGVGADGQATPSPSPSAVVPPCDPAGLGMVDLGKIATDPTLIEGSVANGVKIWGRQSSALIAISLKKTIEQGSTVILSVPSIDGPAMGRVITARQIINSEVDLTGATSLVSFDNINLSGISKLTLVLVPPAGAPSKIDIESKTTEFHPQSKRFATRFKDKPVVDVQLGALPDSEGLAASLANLSGASPIFGGQTNGFGFSRDTSAAFRAVNIRTAGYITDASGSETAHVSHALTGWDFPAKFKTSGTIVTDLLERDISSRFAAATTTALRDDYVFVVYVPDNATTPTLYFRHIISVG
jgi:hypothetical protein